MEIFEFENGYAWQDYHWNEMQRKIYREVKDRTLLNQFQSEILTMEHQQLLYDPIVNEDFIDLKDADNITFEENKFQISSPANENGVFATVTFMLDTPVRDVYLKADTSTDENISFYIVHENGEDKINNNSNNILTSFAKEIQLVININNDDTFILDNYVLYLKES